VATRPQPATGSFYSINEREMHIECAGIGSPTVILKAASSAPWSQWRNVQPELSRLTKVCSYDRAGHGWSEPRDGPRDAETIVAELHALLCSPVSPPAASTCASTRANFQMK
jgi:pimeloyl-ACP methyl ester carboxylesterase